MAMPSQEMRTYSLTAVTAGRRRLFQVTATAQLMMDTLQAYRMQGKFELYAFVVMPDHIHLLMTPAPDVSLEKVKQFVKGGFSFRLKSGFEVWEPGCFDRRIHNWDAFEVCREYIEQNPVRAGLVALPQDYPYSSASQRTMVDPTPSWFHPTARG